MSASGSIEVSEDVDLDGKPVVFVSHVHVAGRQHYRETFKLSQLEAATLLEHLGPIVEGFGK